MENNLEDRIYTYSEYAKKKYSSKVYRVGLSTGIVCPHRKNNGGCIFCNPLSFIGDYQKDGSDISKQLDEGIKKIEKCCGTGKFVAYFQDETSTAGDLTLLKDKYSKAIADKRIVGLILSTRPDYINENIIRLLKSLNTDITVEIGMQTISNESLKFLNRGHTFEQTETAINMLGKNNIRVGVHLILGIHIETIKDMLRTIEYVSNNPYIKEVKFHNLVPYKNTLYGKMIQNGIYHPYKIEEHINNLAEIIPYLRGDIVISRLFTSNVRNTHLNLIKFKGNKTKWMNELRKILIKKGLIQGMYSNKVYNKKEINV